MQRNAIHEQIPKNNVLNSMQRNAIHEQIPKNNVHLRLLLTDD